MYPGEEPPRQHHLPKMDDEDDDDYDDHQPPYPANVVTPTHQHPPATPQQPLQPPKQLFSPGGSHPPFQKRPTPSATPPPQPQPQPQPPMPPQQPLQPPQQLLQPPQQPLQPPQQIFLPTSPPPKSRAPPKHNRDDDDDDDDNKSGRLLCAVITTLLILIGITVLILWLLYRPAKPQFTAVSAAVYSLNTTSPPASFITTSVQLTILTRNPSKRTAIHYDRLTVAVHYRNHPITPPAPLPPLHQRKRSTVMMSPVIGGDAAVATPPEVVEGLAADEVYGVVGLSWVLMGRVRYKAGWFKSGHSRVYVRCDVMLGFKNGGGSNPNGQVPLLGNPPCYVDI